MGGKALWKEHAIETGTIISEMGASYVGLLTLMVDKAAPIYDQIQSGEFELLSPEEVVMETHLMLKSAGDFLRPCVFRSNHASNYISLRGNLPMDKEAMLLKLEKAMNDIGMLKDERFRML